jgi:transcriptional regulator with XRE-family HTH domain
MLAGMSKRVILPGALRAIRELKAATDPAFRTGHFAPACLMSAAHLSNIEADRKSPPEAVICRIADQLGVSIDAISYVITSPQEAAA